MTNLRNENGNYTQAVVTSGEIWENEMSYTDWEEKYKPKLNHLSDNGTQQYETYGDEWKYIQSLDPKYVWTNIDGDNADLIVAGVSYVNRMSYFVCEVPWESGHEQVLVSVEVECECYQEEGYGPFTFSDGYEFFEDGDRDCKKCEGSGQKWTEVD